MGPSARRSTHAFRRVLLVLVTFFLVLGPITPVFAQLRQPGQSLSPIPALPTSPSVGNITSNSGSVSNNGAALASPGSANSSASNGNGGGNGGASKQLSSDQTGQWIYTTAVGLGGWIAGWGGGIFDGAINEVVLRMGCWFVQSKTCNDPVTGVNITANGSVGYVVNTLWKVVRDMFNIVFIFALILIGLRTILNADDAGAQKALGSLIAAALLINFSLYITKTIVDVSNFTAVKIYDTATSGIQGTYSFSVTQNTGSTNNATAKYTAGSKSLSAAYMQELMISSWFTGNTLEKVGQIVVFSIVILFFSIILGLTLAWGGIMLIIRFVALIMYMIFSPAMFIGWVLPQFKPYAKKWWGGFLKYAFFAPAYIFMLYLGLFALSQIQRSFAGSGQSYAAAFGTDWSPGTFSIFVFYAIGLGFLIGATKVASSIGVAGSTTAMNSVIGTSNWLRGRVASSVAGGSAAWIGQKWDTLNGRRGPRSRTGIYLRNKLSSVESNKMGGYTSYKQREDERKAERKRHAASAKDVKTNDTLTQSTITDENEFRTTLRKGKPEQVVAAVRTGSGVANIEAHVGALSDANYKAIMDSPEVAKETKDRVKAARTQELRRNITKLSKQEYRNADEKTRAEKFAEGLSDATASQLAALDVAKDIEPHVWRLQSTQMDALKKQWEKDGLSEDVYQDLVSKRKTKLKEMAGSRANMDKIVTVYKNNKELAKLPDEVLTSEHFMTAMANAGRLTSDMLGKIASESGVDKRTIGENINKHYGSTDNMPPDVAGFFDGNAGIAFRWNGYQSPRSQSGSNPQAQQSAFQQRAAAARQQKNQRKK